MHNAVRFCSGLFLATGMISAVAGAQSASRARRPVPENLAGGHQTFAANCAGCHGSDGRGGERAPDIATAREVQSLPDKSLIRIVQNGIPAAGMPAFGYLGTPTVTGVVAYLRFLQGRSGTHSLPGDPKAGEVLFYGKGRCSECHMVSGKGGFIASDLSSYGQGQPAETIKEAIIEPNKNVDRRAKSATIVMQSGQQFNGVVRNEDNFSIALQSEDGSFHMVPRSDIEHITYSSRSLMPDNYGTTLSGTEINDLISYLLSVGGSAPASSANGQQGKARHGGW